MKKRMLALALAITMAATVIAGCGNSADGPSASSTAQNEAGTTGVSEPGQFPIVPEKITLTAIVRDTAYIGPLSSNTFAQLYEDKTNIHVEYQEVPDSGMKERVSLLLASNEVPDMFLTSTITPADNILYGTQGTFIPLNDYIEKYGMEFKKITEQNPDMLKSISAADGNIYGLPNINAAFHTFYFFKSWINQQWLDKLGLKMPQTTTEFENVLKAFKENDANGDGANDEIPMMGAASKESVYNYVYPFLLNSFVYFDNTHLSLENGKVTFVSNTDAFKKGITWIRSLFAQGLIDETSLTQTADQYKQVGTDPKGARIGVATAPYWWVFADYDANSPDKRSQQYTALANLKGPDGVSYAPLTGTGIMPSSFAITSKCKNPEAAFRWADGLFSDEMTLISQQGKEGVDWDKPGQGALGIDGKPALYKIYTKTDEETSKENNWMANIILANRNSTFRLGMETNMNDPEIKWNQDVRLYNETRDKYYVNQADDKRFPDVALTPEESTELAMLRTQINDYADEQIVLFLIGKKDIEKDWDSYIKQYDKLNLKRYLEVLQTAYDRQYK